MAGVRRHANPITLGLIWGSLLAVIIAVFIVLRHSRDGRGMDGRDWAWIDMVGHRPLQVAIEVCSLQRVLAGLQSHLHQAPPDGLQIRVRALETALHEQQLT